MGQKVNPISNRLGIIRGWDSNWYGGKNYGDSLLEDSKIRKYLNARLAKASGRPFGASLARIPVSSPVYSTANSCSARVAAT